MKESEAWRVIGEAFEARAEHPDLEIDGDGDIANYGMCSAAAKLRYRDDISSYGYSEMWNRIHEEVGSEENHRDGDSYVMLNPRPGEEGGPELRAMLAYLFAEVAA